jgi:hypothetical protein
VNDHRIPAADKSEKLLKLGTFGIFARCVIYKSAVKWHSFQLPPLVLVKGTDPDVAYALSCHIPHFYKSVKIESITFTQICQEKEKMTLS